MPYVWTKYQLLIQTKLDKDLVRRTCRLVQMHYFYKYSRFLIINKIVCSLELQKELIMCHNNEIIRVRRMAWK